MSETLVIQWVEEISVRFQKGKMINGYHDLEML